MVRAPLLIPAAAFLAAIVVSEHDYGLAAALLGIALAFVRRDVAAGWIAGLLIALLHGHPAIVDREYPTARYTGTVVGDVRSEEGFTSFAFACDGIGTLRATAHVAVHAGEWLAVRGRVAPLDEPRNPGEPSARALGLDDGVIGEIHIAALLGRAPPVLRDPRVVAAVVRERLTERARAALPEPEATILAGALWGERGDLPADIRDDFQATGTVHVLVTAGLHLGVIAALADALFALLRLPRVAASLATIPIVYAYAFATGWHLPSQRAAAMITVALVARACGARTVSLNSLAIAAIVVAAAWPAAVESVSFALSFSCVAAIVLFAEPLAAAAARCVPPFLAEIVALTVAAQVGVWPLTAAVFSNLAPYAIVANAIVVPLVGATMIVGIAALATQPIASLGGVFAAWEMWLLAVVRIATHGIALLPGARLTLPPPPWWSIAAYDAAVAFAAVLLRRQPKRAALIVGAACAAVGIAATFRPAPGFTIAMLDVGQGDGIVVRTPNGRTILIDSGGRLERGPVVDGRSPAERAADRTVLPYLRRAGITRIDLLILTHPHGDHVGGCFGILDAMPVRMIFDSGQHYEGQAYRDCIASAREHRVPIVIARRGMRWQSDDGVTLDILAPSMPFLADTGDYVNENSIVAMLCYRDFRALFMGDAGASSEARLLAGGDDLRADVIKVGHHGSAYASSLDFVARVHPAYALISVGRHNTFGHPAPRTVAAWAQSGARVMRTDRCGAVTLRIGEPPATMIGCDF